jgi:hypothetical protein
MIDLFINRSITYFHSDPVPSSSWNSGGAGRIKPKPPPAALRQYRLASCESPINSSSSPSTPPVHHDNFIDVSSASDSCGGMTLSSAADCRRCAFCNLTASSQLGQGDLVKYQLTTGGSAIQPKQEAPISRSSTNDTRPRFVMCNFLGMQF